jgi:hypothetical protein
MISHLPGTEAAPAQTRLCSSLAQGIHAAAQPLTVLLASLSKAHTDPMNSDELRHLTASSAVEIQRVCTLFSSLQQIVMAECIQPQRISSPVLLRGWSCSIGKAAYRFIACFPMPARLR